MLLMARETGCSPGQRAVASGPWIAGLLSNTTIGGDSSRLSATPWELRRPAPTLGQHTREVLAEWAGLGDAAIDDMETQGILT